MKDFETIDWYEIWERTFGGALWLSFITSLGFLVWALADVFGLFKVGLSIIAFVVLSYFIGKLIGKV